MTETSESSKAAGFIRFFRGRNLYLMVTCFVLLGIISGYWYWTRTPQYSLKYVAKAIETHDLTLFEKHVDMDSLLSRAVDQFVDYKSSDSSDGIDSSVKSLAQGFVQLMKPQFVMSAKEQIKAFVEKGDFDKQPTTSTENAKQAKKQDINFGELYTNVGGGGIQYKGIEYTKIEGKIAVVGIKLYYPRLESNVILDVKMRERDGYWQVVEFSNLSVFMQNIDKLEREKIAKLNEQIIAEMNHALVFPDVRVAKKFEDRWGINKSVYIKVGTKNQTSKTINSMLARMVIKNKTNGNIIFAKSFALGENNYIPSGKTNSYSYKVPINLYIDAQKTLWDTSENDMETNITIKSIKFDDGSELKLIDKLS